MNRYTCPECNVTSTAEEIDFFGCTRWSSQYKNIDECTERDELPYVCPSCKQEPWYHHWLKRTFKPVTLDEELFTL